MYHQQPAPPAPYSTADYRPMDYKTPQPETTEVTSRSWFSSEPKKPTPPGWKRISLLRDGLTTYGLVSEGGTPLYTISNALFTSADTRLFPHESTTSGSNPPCLAAARCHTFSSRMDMCLGDYKAQSDPWSSMAIRKDSGFVHDRWRWGMDPSLLPPGLRIIHPSKKKGKWEGQVQFVWQRPGDSAWALDSWELVLDRDGQGKGEVLVKYTEAGMSMSKKGEIEMIDGLGKPWEMLVFVSLNGVLNKETEQIVKLAT